jgi:membrane-associated phospholipid phosphatase
MTNKGSSLLIVIFILFLCNTSQILAQGGVDKNTGTTQNVGDVFFYTLPLVTLGSTFIIGDKKGTWQFAKGFLTTTAITYGLKLGISKERPDGSNSDSFPSGHTSLTFHSAGFVHKRYGFKYAIPSYLLAGFTAASRIDSDKHDIFDVIAGAAIGLGSNLIFTTEYQQEHMELTFNSRDSEYLVGFRYNF